MSTSPSEGLWKGSPLLGSRSRTICFLILAVLLVYHRALDADFVNWDDDRYIQLQSWFKGWTPGLLTHFFTTYEGASYIPLSRLSLAADAMIWGANPFGFHLTSLLIHVANTCLVFLIVETLMERFHRLDFTPWHIRLAALCTALLFALHPMRVESVVWLSERKDVLAGFFGLLATWLYIRHLTLSSRSPSKTLWFLSLAAFTLSLLSKASAATLPVVFFILWFSIPSPGNHRPSIRRGCVGLAPYFLLGIGFGLLAIHAQHVEGAMKTAEVMPMNGFTRLMNIPASLMEYFRRFLVMTRLNPLTLLTRPFAWNEGVVLCGAGVLIITSLITLWWMRRLPLLPGCWLSFLALILPFSGWSLNGGLLMADRYTYLASIPLSLMWIYGCAVLSIAYMPSRIIFSILLFFLPFQSMLRIFPQISYWQDSESLWKHSLAIQDRNPYAWRRLGDAMLVQKRWNEAIHAFQNGVQITPLDPDVWYDLGCAYGKAGRMDDAIRVYQLILKSHPDYHRARFNLAWSRAQKGEIAAALEDYELVAKADPFPEVWLNLGLCHDKLNQIPEALRAYQHAIDDGLIDAWGFRALLLHRTGHTSDALQSLKAVLAKHPSSFLEDVLQKIESDSQTPPASEPMDREQIREAIRRAIPPSKVMAPRSD